MKKLFVISWIVVLIVLWWMIPSAKAFEYSIGVAAGYNQGSLGIGWNNPPLGTAKDNDIPVSVIGRIAYDKYSWKPIIEATYKQARYNEDTAIAHIHLEPVEYSIRAGIEKDFFGIDFLALVGWTHWDGNLYVVQHMTDGSWFSHTNNANGLVGGNSFDVMSFRFGAAKYFQVTSFMKAGIEAGLEYYPQNMKIDRCMTWEKNSIEPYAAIMFKF